MVFQSHAAGSADQLLLFRSGQADESQIAGRCMDKIHSRVAVLCIVKGKVKLVSVIMVDDAGKEIIDPDAFGGSDIQGQPDPVGGLSEKCFCSVQLPFDCPQMVKVFQSKWGDHQSGGGAFENDIADLIFQLFDRCAQVWLGNIKPAGGFCERTSVGQGKNLLNLF